MQLELLENSTFNFKSFGLNMLQNQNGNRFRKSTPQNEFFDKLDSTETIPTPPQSVTPSPNPWSCSWLAPLKRFSNFTNSSPAIKSSIFNRKLAIG